MNCLSIEVRFDIGLDDGMSAESFYDSIILLNNKARRVDLIKGSKILYFLSYLGLSC